MLHPSRRTFFLLLVLLAVFSTAAAQTSTPTPLPMQPETTPETTPESTPDLQQVELILPEVLFTTPHDTEAWTQGFLLVDDFIYESVGENGKSDIRKVDLATGEILQQHKLLDEDYAEGLALVDDRFIQLTWQQEIAYIYDRDTFEQIGTFSYEGEGWGLAYDGEYLWMSNGSGSIAKRDPETFEVVEELPVTLQGLPIDSIRAQGRTLGGLNELEVVGDIIYANVWPTTYILRIDKLTGVVTGIIDGSGLLTEDAPIEPSARSYLNGIAYNAEKDTFLITGKWWPYVFEVNWQVVGVLPPIG